MLGAVLDRRGKREMQTTIEIIIKLEGGKKKRKGTLNDKSFTILFPTTSIMKGRNNSNQ